MTHSYRSEDVQQILQRALAQQQEGLFSRDQLAEMATELGISPEALQSAEQEWLVQQGEEQERRRFNAYRRRTFRSHLVPFVAVNVFLIMLNLITNPHHFWAIYPLLGWGLGLFLHGWQAYQTEGDAYEKAFQAWQQKAGRCLTS